MKRHRVLLSILFVFALIFFYNTLFAQQAGRQVPIKVPISKTVDNALLYLPWDYYLSNKSYPLICFFHGMGEAGNGGIDLSRLSNQGLPNVIKNGKTPYSVNSTGDTTRFIVLSIQAPASGYYSPTPEIMIAGISSLVHDYHLRIDANKVYTTGLSAGGRQSLWAVMNYPSTFPAGVIMSASSPIYSSKVDSFANTYIWLFHGIFDQTASPYNSYGSNDLINAKYPGHSRLTKYDNGHCCWNQFYDPAWKENGVSIYDFMLQHSLSKQVNETQPVNNAPKANAGGYQTISLPTNTVTLTGISSYDPDGKIASYKWTQISGPAQAIFSSMTVVTPKVSDLITGVYVFDLTVKDNDGASDKARTQVTVENTTINIAPKANAGGYQTVSLPTNSVTLTGASSYDPDGKITSCQWNQVSGPAQAAFSDATAINPEVSNLKAGIYILDLTVKDNDGATDKARTQVTVNGSTINKSPRANAGGYQTITLPVNSATLTGAFSYDPDGKIVSYQWAQVSGPAQATFSSMITATPKIGNLVPGVYVFDLTVKDNFGAADKGRTQVTVKASTVNETPRANAGGYQTVILPVNSATLTGSFSYDPDGKIASYHWVQISGPAPAKFSALTSATPQISNLVAGVYVFDLTVKDNYGATDKGRTQVTVKNIVINKAPRANAGGYQTITLPTNSVILTGASSYDPDGEIASYRWTQASGPTQAIFSNTVTANPKVSDLVAGVYSFDLTVKDNDGSSASGRTQVTVTQPALYELNGYQPSAKLGSLMRYQIPKTAVKLKTDSQQTTLQIYPNPVHDKLHISLNNYTIGKNVIRIISMSGSVIKNVSIGESKGSLSKVIDTRGIIPGVYLIQLLNNQVLKDSKKIIKY